MERRLLTQQVHIYNRTVLFLTSKLLTILVNRLHNVHPIVKVHTPLLHTINILTTKSEITNYLHQMV